MRYLAKDLFAAEISAARIEAMTQVDPAVGHVWRAEAALCEAVDTTGLEGIRLSTQDLLPRIAFNGGVDAGDVPAAELALSVLRIIKSPGDPLADPVGVIRRIEEAALFSPPTDRDDAASQEPAPRLSDAEARAVFTVAGSSDMPIVCAAHAAARYGLLTERSNPLIERLVFVAMEGSVRSHVARPGRHLRENARMGSLGTGLHASWIVLPSAALTRPRFLPWSPGSVTGLADLAAGLRQSLSDELGRIGVALAWTERAAAAGEGRHGKSRIADAATAFATQPLMTTADLATRIGITPRGAANLMHALVDEGLIHEITRRRASRIWATPSLAQRLTSATPASSPAPRTAARKTVSPVETRPADADMSLSARMASLDDVFRDFDAAMAKADLLLAQYDRRS